MLQGSTLNDASCSCNTPQVLLEARMTGTLLPQSHRACQAVRRVGLRIAQVSNQWESAEL